MKKIINYIVTNLMADLSPIRDMYLEDRETCHFCAGIRNDYFTEVYIGTDKTVFVKTYGPANREHYLLDKEVECVLKERIDFNKIQREAEAVKMRAKILERNDPVLFNYIKEIL